MVSGADDGAIVVWNVNTGDLMAELVGHDMGVRNVAVSPQSRHAISVAVDGSYAMWDVQQSKQLADINFRGGSVQNAAFSPDGRKLIIAFWSRRIIIWDIENQQETGAVAGNERSVLCVTVTPDGSRIACGSLDRTIRVWNLGAVGGSAVFGGHLRSVTDLVTTSDGNIAVSVSDDANIRVWETTTGRQIGACGSNDVDGEFPLASAAAATADASKVIVALRDHDLLIWDRDSDREMRIATGHQQGIAAIAVVPDSHLIVSGDGDGRLKVWDILTGQQILETGGGLGGIACIAVLPDGHSVIAAREQGIYQVHDLRSGELLGDFGDGNHSPVRLKIFDRFECISLSKQGMLTSWSLKDFSLRATIMAGPSVKDFALLRRENLFITVGRDRKIRGIDFETGAVQFEVVLDYRLQRVVVSEESQTILAGDRAGNLYGFQVSSQ
jgi:WD40 repeat protein